MNETDPRRRPGSPLRPRALDAQYVVVGVAEAITGANARAMVREDEGFTYVLERADADRRGLRYDYVAAWITLGLATALDDVGVTALVSGVLARAGISCNVLAGNHHDHLLVPFERAAEAVGLLSLLQWPVEDAGASDVGSAWR